jgi:uncharacterized membrane protein
MTIHHPLLISTTATYTGMLLILLGVAICFDSKQQGAA